MNILTDATDYKKALASLTAIWWVRILTLGVASVGTFSLIVWLLLFFEPNADTVVDTIPDHSFDIGFFIIILSFSLAYEYSRVAGSYTTLGFSVSKFMVREIITGAVVAIGSLGSIISIAIYSGASLSISNWQSESIIVTVILAALEELFFRGVLLRSIEQRFGSITALLLSSISFGLVHFSNSFINLTAFTNIVLAGVVFGAMYLLTRSLWMSISFHAAWNFIEYSVFGRSPDPMIFAGVPEQSRWLFTGEYGIEQGLCTTIVLVLILIVLPKITTVSPYAAAALFKQQYAEAHLKAS